MIRMPKITGQEAFFMKIALKLTYLKSSSLSPLVVIAGVPSLMPPGTRALLSPGTLFLLSVI